MNGKSLVAGSVDGVLDPRERAAGKAGRPPEGENGEAVDVLNISNGATPIGEAGVFAVDGEDVPRKPSRERVMQSILESLPSHMSQHHHEVALNATCQVDGCSTRLCHLKEYHQRYRVCMEHLKCDFIVKDGKRMRFCQQCGKFQDLQQFDKGKRSCRDRLKKHNERRRKRLDARYAAALALQISEEQAAEDAAGIGSSGRMGPGMLDTCNVRGSGSAGGRDDMGQMNRRQMNDPVYRTGFAANAQNGSQQTAGNGLNTWNTGTDLSVHANGHPTNLNNPVEIISDLVAYMMTVRQLGTTVTDLERDAGSQACANMLNMALNTNFVPKQMPSPRVMALLLHNFAGALKYDVSNMVLTPLGRGDAVGHGVGGSTAVGAAHGAGAYPAADASAMNMMANVAGEVGGLLGGSMHANVENVDLPNAKRVKTEAGGTDVELESNSQGLADLLNFLKESSKTAA